MTGPGQDDRHETASPVGGIMRLVPGYPFTVQMTAALPDDLSAAGAARRILRPCLSQWGMAELADDAELIVSELVANALRHAQGPLTLMIGGDDGALMLAVEDAAPSIVPMPRQADAEATGGRGMLLIAALSRRWGCETGDASKVVWAELAA